METKVAWQHLLCTVLVIVNCGDCTQFHSFSVMAAYAYIRRENGRPSVMNAQEQLTPLVKDGVVLVCDHRTSSCTP